MSKIEVVSVELQRYQPSLPQWADALSTCVGRVTPSVRDHEMTRCGPTSSQPFGGRIEYVSLGDMVVSRIAATPNLFSRSLRTATPSLPVPVLLIIQLSGSCRLDQHERSCTLNPGDWCLADTLHPFDGQTLGTRNEYWLLALERPSDPDLRGLLEHGVACRWGGTVGISRILQSTVSETFKQMHRLGPASGRTLQRAITSMAWDVVREQLEAPHALTHQDMQCARLKSYIESQLKDPELSVESIAEASKRSSRIRCRSRRLGFELSLEPSAKPLRRCLARPQSVASSDYGHLFVLGLQQHLAFQSPVQESIRRSATRISTDFISPRPQLDAKWRFQATALSAGAAG